MIQKSLSLTYAPTSEPLHNFVKQLLQKPRPSTLNPRPSTLNPQPSTSNPIAQTPKSQPSSSSVSISSAVHRRIVLPPHHLGIQPRVMSLQSSYTGILHGVVSPDTRTYTDLIVWYMNTPPIRIRTPFPFVEASLKPGPWTLSGPWTLDPGPWGLDPGPWTLDPGPWTLDPGPLIPAP